MIKMKAVFGQAVTSLAAVALMVGASGCALDAQEEAGESAEVVDSQEQAVTNNRKIALQNYSTSRCLDGNAAGSVYTSGCYWDTYQVWIPRKVNAADTGFQLINSKTGRCLDSNTSGKVYTLPCNNGRFQQWEFKKSATLPAGAERGRWVNTATQLVLDSNTGGSVYTGGNNNGNFQKWNTTPCISGVLCLDI